MKDVIKDNREKQKILELILSSEGFAKSERYGDLLRYLVDANSKGKALKETIIALEFFGRDSDFQPSEDPIVRVYIGNLRKKINHFYLLEGKEEKVRLTIPKGHYDVSFEENIRDKYAFPLNRIQRFISIPLILLLIFFIGSTIFLFLDRGRLSDKAEVIPKANPLWYEFLNDKKPVLVVLGDYFFMAENRKDTLYKAYIRYSDVNSLDDYNQIIKNGSESGAKLKPLNFTYLRPSISYSLVDILPIISQSPNEVILKLASEIIWSDIDHYNIVYIGSYKTTYLLNKLLKNNNIEYNIRPSRISIVDAKNTPKTFVTELPDQGQRQKDYGSIIKIKSSSENVALFFLGFDELGIQASATKMADPAFIELLEVNFPEIEIKYPFYFKYIFEIQGYRRTNLNSEIKFFEIIPENID